MNDTLVILFCKAPLVGKAKTRLSASIGNRKAYLIYEYSLRKTITKLKKINSVDRMIAYSSGTEETTYFNKLVKNFKLIRDEKGTFNQKLSASFYLGFRLGYKKVIAIGADSPDLPKDYIMEGISKLSKYDSVIGFTKDGGYYLLGLRSPDILEKVFKVKSSKSNTALKIEKVLRKAGKRVKIIPRWYDIDTVEDLNAFRARHPYTNPFGKSGNKAE